MREVISEFVIKQKIFGLAWYYDYDDGHRGESEVHLIE